MKKIILSGMLGLFILSGCSASIGVGTGFNIGGVGVGVGLSGSQPLKKKDKKTAEQVVEERLEKEKEINKK